MPNNHEIVVTENLGSACGAVTYWSLSGTCDSDQLAAAWEAAGLNKKLLPALPSPSVAMRRALGELSERRRLVRPMAGHRGLALVRENASEEDLAHDIELRAKVNAVGRLQVSPPDHPLAEQLRAAYGRHLNELSHQDVSGWLCRMVHEVHATPLRESGGFYFVPPGEQLETWRKMTNALGSCSAHQVFELPAMHSEQAVRAVLAAVTREAAAEAAAMEAELAAEESLGRRALQTRERRCQAMVSKLGAYEGLLGGMLDDLKDRLGDLQAQIGAAALAAMPDDEEVAS